MLDLDERTDAAVAVLEGLVQERDDQPAVWHLLAAAHHGACAFGRARRCLECASALLRRAPPGDPAAAAEAAEQLDALRCAVDASERAWREDGLPCDVCDDDDDDDGEEEGGEEGEPRGDEPQPMQ